MAQPNEDLVSFINGKKLTDNSMCLHAHTHGKHLRRRDNRLFSYFEVCCLFFHVINGYQQIRKAQEYKGKFAV